MAELIPSLRPDGIGADQDIRETNRQAAAVQAEQEANAPSFGETWRAATDRNFAYKALDRIQERDSRPVDPNYRVDPDRIKSLAKDYSERELEMVASAVSEDDFEKRQAAIREARKNQETISQAGLSGFGAEIAASLIDPTMIPLMLSTGGGAAASKVGLLARAARGFGAGAAISGGIETTLMEADTTKDWSDVLLATVTGGVVSGAVPVALAPFQRASRGGADFQPTVRDAETWDAAKAVDADLRQAGVDARESGLADDLQGLVDNTVLTSRDSRQSLVEELTPLAEQRLSRGVREADTARIKTLEYQIEKARAEAKAAEAPVNIGMTNKARKANAAENAAARADTEARVKPLQDEIDSLRAKADEDAKYQEAWKDISRLNNGIVPERLKQRFEELEAARRGPVAEAERRLAKEKADAGRAQAQEVQPESTNVDAESGQSAQPSTVGAAQVQGAQFADEMHLVNEAGPGWDAIYDGVRLAERAPANWQNYLLGSRHTRDYLQSTYSTLDQAPSNLIRGLNIKLNANPQAGLKGHIPASHYQDMFMRRAINAEGSRERDAVLEFAKSRGIPGWKMELGIAKERQEFDNLVVLHMRGKVTSNDPAIQKAARARADMLKQSVMDRKGSGVYGFEEVTHDDRYFPFILETTKMQAAYRKHGEKAVEDLLTGAYQRGKVKLSEKAARLIARAQMRRTLDKGLSSQTGIRNIFSEPNREFLGKELKAAGMSPEAVNSMLDDMADVSLHESISKRAKFSLGASISHSEGQLRMVDLLNTSQDVVMNYAREGAGESALAKQGFKTRAQADEAIDEAVAEARNLLQNQLADAKKAGDADEVKRLARLVGDSNDGRIQQYAEMLHDSIRLLMGETLDTNFSPWAQSAIRLSRAARKATGILRLGWNGAASIPEASNALVTFGLRKTLKNVPATKWFQVGRLKEDPKLEAMYRIMGAYGHKENYFASKNYMAANMGEDAQSRLERIYNNGAGYIQDKNMLLSGFRTVQSGSEELAQRAMLDQILQAAEGKLKFDSKDLQIWREAGLSDDEFHEVLDYIRANPEHVDVDGKQVRVFSADSMDPELRDKLGAAMTAILGRQMQRNFIGETSVWSNKELGKLITQFRTFSLVSLEKQLAYGLRGNHLVLAQKLMWSTALAYLAYNGRIYMQSKLKDDPEQYIRQSTGGVTEAIGILNMSNVYGGFGIPLDGLATVNALPDSWMAGGASGGWGFRGYGVDSIPAAGVAADAQGLTSASFGALKGLLSGEGVEDEDAEKIGKKLRRMLPLANTAAVGAALSVIP